MERSEKQANNLEKTKKTKGLFGFFQRVRSTCEPSTSQAVQGFARSVRLRSTGLTGLAGSFAVVALALFSGLFLFSNSAYATDISISSSGKVSFGKVQPSSIGTLATGEDELSVSTTCSEGVSVYATSVNNSESGTSLINEAAKILDTSGTNESTYTISASTNTIGSGSATALANNTWGLNTNAEEAGNNLYYGLPAYSTSSLPPAIYTGAGTSIPVYYGAKVTNTLVPGTYAGEVLYTVTVNTACLNYTVTFNKNAEGASGTMESQTILPAGGSLRANSFEYSGYTFLGWSTSPEGKTGTAVDGIGTEADVEYENEALFPDATTSPDIKPGDDVALYAIWEKAGYGEDTMQGWTGCAALAANASVTLTDARDKKQYVVKKLPDGKCWMMQNLTLNGVKLTPNDTNIADGNTYYLPKDGGAGSLTDPATKNKTTGYNFASGYDNQAMFKFRAKNSSYTNDSDTGYYNFYTATLGFSYYNDGKTYGTSTQDICPVNWHLPRTPNTTSGSISSVGSDNDFTYLARQYTSSWSGTSTRSNYVTIDYTAMTAMYISAASPLATSTANNYAGFSYSGYWNGPNNSAGSVGSNGLYWSASVYSTGNGYFLSLDSSSISPQNIGPKYFGNAVRCVREPSYMQDFDSSTLASNQVVSLIDKRDNHAYKVKKLPDGKVWMIQNLTLSADDMVTEGKALTSADTNIDNNTTYYLPKRGYQGSITSSSTPTSTSSTVGFSTSSDNQGRIGYRAKGTTDNDKGNPVPEDTAYYDFYTATLGFSYYNDGKDSGSSPRDICPKGWRLPKVSDNGTSVVAASSEFANLARTYNSNASWSGLGQTSSNYYTSDDTIRKNMILGASGSLDPTLEDNGAAGFTYAGYYDSTALYYVGTFGRYWSASVCNSYSGYNLNFNTSYVSPQNGNNKSNGLAVRCVTGS